MLSVQTNTSPESAWPYIIYLPVFCWREHNLLRTSNMMREEVADWKQVRKVEGGVCLQDPPRFLVQVSSHYRFKGGSYQREGLN